MKTWKITEKHHGTQGANLTYLAPSGQFFMGVKSFIGIQEMQRIFAFKNKHVFTMKKCTVSMATVSVILEYGGVHTKLAIYLLLLTLDH